MPNSPPSLTFPMNEDCLYLNVYSPKPPADGSKLPVMVYIHGGAFDQGSGNMYDGTQLAKRGVVVVTINYRLDVLGFLCTEDGSSLGNYGLMDQIKALEWVRDSISAFNGDPNDVTIFGESAGGASVSLLILARQARGLFQKGIMESGVSLCPWAVSYPRLQPEPLSQAVELARRMECATHATNELVACLRTKDAMALLNATTDMRNSDPSIMLFRPVPETTFGHLLNVFDSDPQSLLEHGLFSNVSTIRGYNAHEAGWTIHDPEDDGITLDEFKAIMHEIVTDYLIRNPRPIRIASMESLLLDLYVNTPNITDPKELREAYIQ
nr:hypothetical protein BaRGS_034148 [Batillaria attramentaria]